MPHVKGNKFKPKPSPGSEPVPNADTDTAVDVAAEGADGQDQQLGKKRKGGKPAFIAPPTVLVQPPKGKGTTLATGTSNWAALSAAMPKPYKRFKSDGSKGHQGVGGGAAGSKLGQKQKGKAEEGASETATATRVLAIDCEMVGVGPDGILSALARVSIINAAGQVLLDTFVKPKERITDYRTRYSGVRPADLKSAPKFEEIQPQVASIIQGRILVGHAVVNDLEALMLSHDVKDVRDTAHYPPFMKARADAGKLKSRALRHLAKEHLGTTIQEGEHNPIEDARTALMLYQKHKGEWEKWHAKHGGKLRSHQSAVAHAASAKRVMTLEELAQNDYMNDL